MRTALFATAAVLALGLAACGGEAAKPAEPAAPAAEATPPPAPEPTATPANAMGETPDDVAGFMKTRHDNFHDLGKNFKVIAEAAKSTTAPDMAAVTAAAAKVKEYSEQIGTWFPPGTGPESGNKTLAKANIWSDRATFDADLAKLKDEAAKLAMVTDAAGLKAQFPATGMTCKGCHDTFREEDKDHDAH